MAHVIATYPHMLATHDGHAYTSRSCGRQRSDGLWEGWLEFVPSDGTPVLRSARETTQPKLQDLAYWASGLTRVYLEGALERTLNPPLEAATAPPPPPAYDAPAPRTIDGVAVHTPAEPILDPFAVYAEGETLLRRRLAALAPLHLRTIARAYELADDLAIEELDEHALVALIVSAVRDRAA